MELRKTLSIFLASVIIAISVAGGVNQYAYAAEIQTLQAEDENQSAGVRLEDDFQGYVAADVLAQNEIPEGENSWAWYKELLYEAQGFMDDYIDTLSNDGVQYEKGTSEQKIKDLYELYLNKKMRDEVGNTPIQGYIDDVRNAKNIDEFVDAVLAYNNKFGAALAYENRFGATEAYNKMFAAANIVPCVVIEQDYEDSSTYAAYLEAANTLIGKTYIDSPELQDKVEYYFGYMEDIFEEYGMSKDEAVVSRNNVERLLRLICSESLSAEQSYDYSLAFKRCSVDELKELFSNIDVDKMLKTLRIDGLDSYIVYDEGKSEMVNSLLVEENLPALKDYFTFCLLHSTAPYRSTKAADLYYEFLGFMNGTERQSDDKIAKKGTESWLGWEFGQIYVKENFSEEDKENVIEIIEQIKEEYAKIIDRQDWLSDTTKEIAKKKLATMNVKIGYPDEWPDIMELNQIVPLSEGGSLLSDALIDTELLANYNISLIGTEVNRNDWDGVTPQTVNAYYDPCNNAIMFPAGILQAPYYSSDNTYAQNMGGIGYTIAHEISHAFDSEGGYFDEIGNYNDWWTEEDRENYDKLEQAISDYYSKYQILGLNVNGELTVNEDIADLGAMTCVASILAGDDEALKEAFTQAGYAEAFKATDSYKLNLLNTDTHAPGSIRVNAVLSSCDAFYRVFNIKEGDGMYVAPKNRVGIWK